MVYKWKQFGDGGAAGKAGVSAQVFGERLEAIKAANGGNFTKQHVVHDARPEESPIHPLFEWDDSVAGEKWREVQAQAHLRQLVVVIESEQTTEQVETRAYVSVQSEEEDSGTPRAAYVAIADAKHDPLLMRQIVMRAQKDMELLRKRYAEYKALAGIFAEAMEAIDKQLELLKQGIAAA